MKLFRFLWWLLVESTFRCSKENSRRNTPLTSKDHVSKHQLIVMGKIALYGLMTFLGSSLSLLIGISVYMFTAMSFAYSLMNSSALVLCLSLLAIFIDLGIVPKIEGRGQKKRKLKYDPIKYARISVVMTAYNDEASVAEAVIEFKNQPGVEEVVVVDNNSLDDTATRAREAGAKAVTEKKQGYGFACMRALREAKYDPIVLVESDMTYAGYDVKKLIAYLENADMVVGTRSTQELLDQDTQLNWFLNWGNFFIAKLLQLKYWGKIRLTDVGCTYRAIRRDALSKIINQLKEGGMIFSPEMIMVALKNNLKVIEIPVSFRRRWGRSKGAGRSNWAAFKIGLKMLLLILTL